MTALGFPRRAERWLAMLVMAALAFALEKVLTRTGKAMGSARRP